MSGVLSIVATPIGNLEDITLRALRVLREADVVLAEDTRRTALLLRHHGIDTPTRAYHAHSKERDRERILDALREGQHLALVTDAGMPVISDPGQTLVDAARGVGAEVVCLPGASAVTTALALSGLPADGFRFVGFLPRGGSRRRRLLTSIAQDEMTTVLFESPRRIGRTLEELAPLLGGERRVALCRELTKLHEEVARGSARELADRYAEGARGEVTLVVEGRRGAEATEASRGAEPPSEAEISERIRAAREAGLGAKAIAKELAAMTDLTRREAYARVRAELKGSE